MTGCSDWAIGKKVADRPPSLTEFLKFHALFSFDRSCVSLPRGYRAVKSRTCARLDFHLEISKLAILITKVNTYPGGGERYMAGVRVKDNEPIESAIRRFKKQCEKAGILQELKKREHYEKPSVRRKRKAIAARKRALRRASRSFY